MALMPAIALTTHIEHVFLDDVERPDVRRLRTDVDELAVDRPTRAPGTGHCPRDRRGAPNVLRDEHH
eukprot:8270422-Heterocapsa_arctica.AAC.1